MTESKEEPKSPLMRVKEESKEAGLKLSIKKTKITASIPITSWQIEGEKVEAVTGSLVLGSKITAEGDCSYEIRRLLASWKEIYEKLRQCFKKQRHQFANKGPNGQSYGLFSSHIQM